MTHVTSVERDRDPLLVCGECGETIDETNDEEAHWPAEHDGEIPVHHYCCTDCDEATQVRDADREHYERTRS